MNKRRIYAVLCGLIFYFCCGYPKTSAAGDQLHLFVGAGLRQPVDHLVKKFEGQTGHQVFIDYAGGGQLLARIKASGRGDVYIPGAYFYIEKLEKEDKVHSCKPIVQHTPVVGVNIATSAHIKTFSDLTQPGVKLAMGDPQAMAFGRTAMAICEKSGRKEAILKNVIVYGATVKQLALYVCQASVDAAIIGRCDAFQNRDKIRIVSIPAEYFQAEIIAAAVLKTASNPGLADQLSDFLSSPDAVAVFEKYGFLPLAR